MVSSYFALTQYNGAIVGPIARILAYIINGIYSFFSMAGIENAALCIVLFTFIMRALMVPIYYKQQKVSKLASRMNPEIQAISKKYRGKRDIESQRKMQRETQAVYEKYGTNPLGGCLPLLITLPIMIGLYRIIQSLPAYMPVIRDLYENIANPLMGQKNYASVVTTVANSKGIEVLTTGEPKAILNSLIDVLATFNQTKWAELAQKFPDIANIITPNATSIEHINNVFGLFSISDRPGFSNPVTFIIPVLAGVLQFINGKQMFKNQPQADSNNQMAAVGKSMTNFMPFMQAFFCLTFPIGVGIYWVAGSVFMIIQQYFFNKMLEKVDVEEMIKKNQEKAAKKRERRGEKPDSDNFNQFAKTSTRSIAYMNTASKDKKANEREPEKGITFKVKDDYKVKDYVKKEGEYKAKNIKEIANMLRRD